MVHDFKWTVRQAVKPSPFHGEVTGSIPVPSTKNEWLVFS
jgi:hypothetical protein